MISALFCYKISIICFYFLGQQEYSARTAGITSGIVLMVTIPLVLAIIFGIYIFLKRNKKNREEEEDTYEDPYKMDSLRYVKNYKIN